MNTIEIAKEVFDIEIQQLNNLKLTIDKEFEKIIECILESKGRVIITGIGKSGIIGKKIAASLASTGTNSFFMHAAEALHGDLGMVYKDDIVIAISNSGSSQEVIDILPSLKRIGCTIVAMTGNIKSTLAKESNFTINIGVEREACPLNLAPTSSTTATLVMGDALVIALLRKRNFKPEKFALYHPGGALGRRLLTRVKDLMNTNIPKVNKDASLKEVLDEIINKRLTMTMVIDNEKVLGIITDGDVRRNVFDSYDNIKELRATDIMSEGFKYINSDEMLSFALEKFEEEKVSSLVVLENESVVGIITFQDIIDFGI